MNPQPHLTGDPHVDARLEAWRPEQRTADPLDRLPAPGRERHARVAFAVLLVVIAAIALGSVVIAFAAR